MANQENMDVTPNITTIQHGIYPNNMRPIIAFKMISGNDTNIWYTIDRHRLRVRQLSCTGSHVHS